MSVNTYCQVWPVPSNMTISLLTHFPQAPFQDSRPPSSYNPVCHDLSPSSVSPLLTTAPVDLIKTRVQQGDATLSKQHVSRPCENDPDVDPSFLSRHGGAIRSTARSIVSSSGVLGL